MANTKPKKAGTKKSATPRKRSSADRANAKKRTTGKPTDEPGVVLVDRREAEDRRCEGDRRKTQEPVAEERRKIERRAKVNRRRQIDPTTCERDYSPDEIEFMNALDEYKRASGRMFPTCSEILEVIQGLGYQKRPDKEPLESPASEAGAQTEIGPMPIPQVQQSPGQEAAV